MNRISQNHSVLPTRHSYVEWVSSVRVALPRQAECLQYKGFRSSTADSLPSILVSLLGCLWVSYRVLITTSRWRLLNTEYSKALAFLD